jgi:hypothetical protein
VTQPIALPFGLREVKVAMYNDAAATTLGAYVKFPNARTLSFAEAEEFEDLRGDDALQASHGLGAEVEWELEGGGLPLEAVATMYGGEVTETGVTPNRVKTHRKFGPGGGSAWYHSQRPYFRIRGRSISDSGGDVWCVIYRAKATDNLEGELADGQFFLTGASGKGYFSKETATLNRVYDWVQNETETALP